METGANPAAPANAPRPAFASATPLAGGAAEVADLLQLLAPSAASAPAEVEIVGGYNADGEYLGPVERPVIMKPEESGVYGQAGHVFFTHAGRLAVAVRSRRKASWPGGLDFTAAGVSAPGETELQTALREAREETGVELDPRQLRHILSWTPRDGYCSRGSLYLYPWDGSPIPFNPEDIEEIRWLTPLELVSAASAAREVKTDLRWLISSPDYALLDDPASRKA